MGVAITKKNLPIFIGLFFITPIVLTIVLISQWKSEAATINIIILAVIWAFAILSTILVINETKKNPYPLSYLVDYDTLIRYMKDEDKFSIEHKLEAGFHFYLYQNKEKIEVQSWHHDKSENKGNIYYWNKEEFESVDSLVNNKIKKSSNYLIELIDSDNKMLNDYKKNHPELDVTKAVEELNK